MDQPRLPIDPDPRPDVIVGSDAATSHRDADEPTLRVSELTAAVQVALDVCFPDEVWVRGEISSLSRPRSGHVYFQLVEPGPPGAPPVARVSVTLFASDKASVNATLRRVRGVRMTDGVEIRIRGRLSVYQPQGQLQLRMSAIDPEYTLGRLASDRERILLALRADDLLDRNGRLPMPPRPRLIGLVTSAGSAAEADFLHELDHSGFGFQVVVADAPVQGRDADRFVAAAAARLAARGVEVVAVVRGGGARTDLAAFDSERLARAIATLEVPVLTGVGHELDTSVADLVAHTACKTPTACAAHIVARAAAFHRLADQLWESVANRADTAVAAETARLHRRAATAARLGTSAVGAAGTRLDERGRRLSRSGPRAVEPARHRLEALGARVAALDPARALARGWSITRTGDGRLVRDATRVAADDILVTTLASGTVTSRVIPPRDEHPRPMQPDDDRTPP